MGVPIYHQSSFQGGDGYRLFGTPALAQATISGIFAAEMAPPRQYGWPIHSTIKLTFRWIYSYL